MRTRITTVPLSVKQSVFKRGGIDSIPLEPKIPLKNFLLNLVTATDGKESSIYLRGVEKFIQEIWGEMVKCNWRKLKVDEFIPRELGISQIYAYKNGRKAMSIQTIHKLFLLWKAYSQKDEEAVKKKWDAIYKSNFSFSIHKGLQPTKLPKDLTPKLSYLMGFICGDGHLIDYGCHYLIKISEKSINQLNYILKPLIKQLFNIEAPIFHIYGEGYALQFGNKPIFRFLTRVLKLKVGEIPKIIKSVDPVNKKYFLMGLFDSEGSVDPSYLGSRIVICQSDYKFLEEVINLFNDLNIYFNGPYKHKSEKGIWYRIEVRRKSEIVKYINEIGSCHIDKLQKLKILEEELYAHGYRYNSARCREMSLLVVPKNEKVSTRHSFSYR